MPKPKSFLRVFTETGPLVALSVAIALLIGIAGPASAQFFNFGGFGGPPQRQAPQRGGGWFGGDFFQPFQQSPSQQQAPRQDFSRAPGPAKRAVGRRGATAWPPVGRRSLNRSEKILKFL